MYVDDAIISYTLLAHQNEAILHDVTPGGIQPTYMSGLALLGKPDQCGLA